MRAVRAKASELRGAEQRRWWHLTTSHACMPCPLLKSRALGGLPPAARPRRPPELITEGILTKAADVYAFGVITWEIYCGR